jgi:hypothetical protein
MLDDLMAMVLEARNQSYQVAFETAVRTGTALIVARNGKMAKIQPPFKYELVPIKPTRQKKKKARG